MGPKSIDRHFKVFSIVQALIILFGGFISVKGNFSLGWSWFFFFLTVLYVSLTLLFTYYLYKNHRLSAIWAILIWAMQVVNIESDFVSWTLSLGIAFSLELNLDTISIKLNLIALPMLIWVTYITLKQRMLAKTGSGSVSRSVNAS